MGKAETIIINEEEGFLSWFSLFFFLLLSFRSPQPIPATWHCIYFPVGMLRSRPLPGWERLPECRMQWMSRTWGDVSPIIHTSILVSWWRHLWRVEADKVMDDVGEDGKERRDDAEGVGGWVGREKGGEGRWWDRLRGENPGTRTKKCLSTHAHR